MSGSDRSKLGIGRVVHLDLLCPFAATTRSGKRSLHKANPERTAVSRQTAQPSSGKMTRWRLIGSDLFLGERISDFA